MVVFVALIEPDCAHEPNERHHNDELWDAKWAMKWKEHRAADSNLRTGRVHIRAPTLSGELTINQEILIFPNFLFIKYSNAQFHESSIINWIIDEN